jgi:hypothetical protein
MRLLDLGYGFCTLFRVPSTHVHMRAMFCQMCDGVVTTVLSELDKRDCCDIHAGDLHA